MIDKLIDAIAKRLSDTYDIVFHKQCLINRSVMYDRIQELNIRITELERRISQYESRKSK